MLFRRLFHPVVMMTIGYIATWLSYMFLFNDRWYAPVWPAVLAVAAYQRYARKIAIPMVVLTAIIFGFAGWWLYTQGNATLTLRNIMERQS